MPAIAIHEFRPAGSDEDEIAGRRRVPGDNFDPRDIGAVRRGERHERTREVGHLHERALRGMCRSNDRFGAKNVGGAA